MDWLVIRKKEYASLYEQKWPEETEKYIIEARFAEIYEYMKRHALNEGATQVSFIDYNRVDMGNFISQKTYYNVSKMYSYENDNDIITVSWHMFYIAVKEAFHRHTAIALNRPINVQKTVPYYLWPFMKTNDLDDKEIQDLITLNLIHDFCPYGLTITKEPSMPVIPLMLKCISDIDDNTDYMYALLHNTFYISNQQIATMMGIAYGDFLSV